MRKVLSMIAMISVFAMVLTFAGCGGGSGSAEDVVETAVNALFDGDASAIMDCIPEFAFDGEDMDEAEEELQDMLDEFLEEADETDWDYTVEVKQTKDKSKDLIEEIEDDFDLSKKDLESIEEAAMVEMTLTIEVDGEEEELPESEVLCVMIDGSWYILSPGALFGSMFGF